MSFHNIVSVYNTSLTTWLDLKCRPGTLSVTTTNTSTNYGKKAKRPREETTSEKDQGWKDDSPWVHSRYQVTKRLPQCLSENHSSSYLSNLPYAIPMLPKEGHYVINGVQESRRYLST